MPARRAHALSRSQPATAAAGVGGGRGTGQGAAQGAGQWSGLQLSRLQTRCRSSAGFVQTARVAPWSDAPPSLLPLLSVAGGCKARNSHCAPLRGRGRCRSPRRSRPRGRRCSRSCTSGATTSATPAVSPSRRRCPPPPDRPQTYGERVCSVVRKQSEHLPSCYSPELAPDGGAARTLQFAVARLGTLQAAAGPGGPARCVRD